MTGNDIQGRVLAATSRFLAWRDEVDLAERPVKLDDAVTQDLMIAGIDVDDYIGVLESEFGPVIETIPWFHYTDQHGSYRGCTACLVIPLLIPWAILKRFIPNLPGMDSPDWREYPHRLTLRMVADAVEAGGWPEDWRPE